MYETFERLRCDIFVKANHKETPHLSTVGAACIALLSRFDSAFLRFIRSHSFALVYCCCANKPSLRFYVFVPAEPDLKKRRVLLFYFLIICFLSKGPAFFSLAFFWNEAEKIAGTVFCASIKNKGRASAHLRIRLYLQPYLPFPFNPDIPPTP